MRDVAGRIGERTSVCTEREAAQLPLSRGDLTNRATSGRHGKQLHVAVGLSVEVDRLAVGRPGGAAGVETPISRQTPCRASACGNDADVVLRVRALGADERDRLSGRGPGGGTALCETGWKRARRAIADLC